MAREHDLRAHMDGARLMNAVVAAEVPADVLTSIDVRLTADVAELVAQAIEPEQPATQVAA